MPLVTALLMIALRASLSSSICLRRLLIMRSIRAVFWSRKWAMAFCSGSGGTIVEIFIKSVEVIAG